MENRKGQYRPKISSHSHNYANFSLIPKHSLPSSSSFCFSNPAKLATCSSMGDRNPKPMKSHKLNSEVQTHHANPNPNPSKLVNSFLFKATIFTVFLVILPLLPSILPEFINLNLNSRSWELIQLICVGIAVTYGLFSKKNEGNVEKEHHNSLFDNANSYITRLLQVSSVFDEEVENPSVSDTNKLQSWSSQYYREEPISMVAKESTDLEEQTAISSRIDEKPLLLPVRSLKHLVSDSNAAESSLYDRSGLNNSGSKRFGGVTRKSVKGDALRMSSQKEKVEEKFVHPSPIPWRSRSGRMEMKLEEDSPLMEDFDLQFRRSNSSRSLKFNPTNSSSPPTRLSTFPYVGSESKREIFDDTVRRNIHYPKSSPPPAPPPPPPMKSKSGLSKDCNFLKMDSSVESVEPSLSQLRKANSGSLEQRPKAQSEISLEGKFVRPVRPNWKELAEKVIAKEVEKSSMDRLPGFKKETSMEYHKEDEDEKIVETDERSETESENEEDGFEGSFGKYESDCEKEEAVINENENENENATDHEGPDVDKKADEFIAKFREQIRLQRIESIRRSTDQHSRNHSR